MKTILWLGLFFGGLVIQVEANGPPYISTSYPHTVKSNSVTVTFEPITEVPESVAVLVQTNEPEADQNAKIQAEMDQARRDIAAHHYPNPHSLPTSPVDQIMKNPHWLPFTTNLLVDLGPGGGKRDVLFAYKFKGRPFGGGWIGSSVMVQTSAPVVVFTSPQARGTSQPMIQLTGYVTSDLDGALRYQLLNEQGVVTGQGECLVNDRHLDPATFNYTATYFTCHDIALNPGTNTFVLQGTDQAGYAFTTNFVCVFTTAGDTTPPVFKIDYPPDGASANGSTFAIQGSCDDPTAKVTVLVCNDEGKAMHMDQPRDYIPIYFEYVPLAEGKTFLTVVASDVAGNSSFTNLTVTKSTTTLTIDSVNGNTVAGFISDTNYTVFANGTKAMMNTDGHWVAYGVRNPNPVNVTTDPVGDITPTTNSWLPTICGQPVENNSVSAGCSFQPVSTNAYNHYRIYLGFTNTSGGNIPSLTWMLPREEARFVLHLYDQTNKEIAKNEWQVKTGLPLATNLNIHHLGKDALVNIDGIIPFKTNTTVRIAALNLDQHFQLPPPGDYRLEVTERLYKIALDGQLVPFEFPSVTTTIKIIDQPSEMVFYLNDLQRQGKLVWGAERYGLRIGVAHGLNEGRGNAANPIEIFLQSTGTNYYRNWSLWQPKAEEQFDVTLYDANRKQVSKTPLGMKQGQPLSLEGQNPQTMPSMMKEYNGFIDDSGHRFFRGLPMVLISPKDATERGHFNLNDYFEIKTPGQYWLTYQQRFYRMNTNSILTGVIMPMVTVPLDISYISSQ